jgi:hypothetical protein
MRRLQQKAGLWLGITVAATLMAACATPTDLEPPPPPQGHTLIVAAANGELLRVAVSNPRRVLARVPLNGLAPGETLLGIDFRVARGVLYGLTSTGRLVTIDTGSGRVIALGAPVALQGQRFGVDFNPTVDRVRVVSDTGLNLRLHPDTGAPVSVDPALNGESPLAVTAAAYTYNQRDTTITTNFAIDAATGRLVRQGSAEGVQPVVSPNTGRIAVVGPLGTGPVDDVSFDIADTDNAAFAALTQGRRTTLHRVDLATGQASPMGRLADGGAIWGLAVEP